MTLDGSHLRIEEQERVRIAQRIKKHILTAGPCPLFESLIGVATASYDQSQERYHLVSSVSMAGGAASDFPVGYLVNLCASMFGKNMSRNELLAADGRSAVALASQFVAAMDIQVALPYETLSPSHDRVPELLTKLALTDSIRTFPQLSPSRLEWIVSTLCEQLPAELSPVPLPNTVGLAKGMFESTRNANGLCYLSFGTICHFGHLAPDALARLALHFSMNAPSINAGYCLPEETSKATLHDKPLIRAADGFWLVDPAISAHAFLIALLGFLKSGHSNAGAEVGAAMERLVREYAKARLLRVEHGTYLIDGIDGECDCVIETELYVYFIECKHREFHDDSRTRDDILFQDLRRVLIEPLVQAGGHEVQLRTHGRLLLHRNGSSYLLELRGRKVERIAITLCEFGSLQSREVVECLLTLSTGATWNSTDPQVRSALSTLKRFSKKLAQQHRALIALGARDEDDQQPQFNRWALSLSQFLTILDEVTPEQSFDDAMEKTRHVRSGTLDEYYERKRMRCPTPTLRQLVEFGKTRKQGFFVAG